MAAWLFAAYFALAWLLLLGVIIRPDHVTRPMLLVLVAVALVTQVPLALALEQALHSSTTALGNSIVTVGIPEELAKAIPIVVVALIYRRSHGLLPRDYPFLGAVSGLVFGAITFVWRFLTDPITHAGPAVRPGPATRPPATPRTGRTGRTARTEPGRCQARQAVVAALTVPGEPG